MKRQNLYFKQVELLVRIMPMVGSVKCFALKGGTAINLFYYPCIEGRIYSLSHLT